jgi:thiosulfate/3-mercaptopyruvate sulfurtransferase
LELLVIPPVVDQGWLRDHDEVIVADVRWYLDGRSGRAAFLSGHLPGAVFVDLDRVLAAPASKEQGRHPLPEPQQFCDAMARLGIGDGDSVVAYDDAGGVIAARLVWMLRAIGHRATLLDGGIGLYDGQLETAERLRAPSNFTCAAWPDDRVADLSDAISPRNVVVDARDRGRFRGEPNPADPRPGHIPGARNVPCRENLGADGALLPVEAIRARFEDAGVREAERVVSYCGSGVTACHNLLTMEHVGLGIGRLYPGSWSQYGERQDLPAETGEAPA